MTIAITTTANIDVLSRIKLHEVRIVERQSNATAPKARRTTGNRKTIKIAMHGIIKKIDC